MNDIKKFNELGIRAESTGFEGDKIAIDRILNKEVIVNAFKIVDSKFPDKSPLCLHMQITIDDRKHVVFTGSKVLQGVLERVPKEAFPFATTIVRDNRRFEFT